MTVLTALIDIYVRLAAFIPNSLFEIPTHEVELVISEVSNKIGTLTRTCVALDWLTLLIGLDPSVF